MKDTILKVEGSRDSSYHMGALTAATSYPAIPHDVLQTVLNNGGTYKFKTYTITRVSQSYIDLAAQGK